MSLWGALLFACINATQADMDEAVRNTKLADAALEVDNFEKARELVAAVFLYIRNAKTLTNPEDGKVHTEQGVFDPPSRGVLRRAARARALLRSRDPKSTAGDRAWAVTIFEKEVLPGGSDPATLADYAEIISRVPKLAPQAAASLRALAQKDLIGSAHAYAALATLEKQAGDATGETDAREKCKTRTKLPAICG